MKIIKRVFFIQFFLYLKNNFHHKTTYYIRYAQVEARVFFEKEKFIYMTNSSVVQHIVGKGWCKGCSAARTLERKETIARR